MREPCYVCMRISRGVWAIMRAAPGGAGVQGAGGRKGTIWRNRRARAEKGCFDKAAGQQSRVSVGHAPWRTEVKMIMNMSGWKKRFENESSLQGDDLRLNEAGNRGEAQGVRPRPGRLETPWIIGPRLPALRVEVDWRLAPLERGPNRNA
jgi:hypothetical protein